MFDVVLYSTASVEMGRLQVTRADLTRLENYTSNGFGLIRVPDDGTYPARVVSVRNVGWFDVTEVS